MSTTRTSVLVLGASGRTGRLLVSEALNRSIEVTVLVRKAASFEQTQGLTIVEGTPLELSDLRRAAKAAQSPISAIVSTLGQTRKSGSPWAAPTSPPRFMADATVHAVTVAKENSIPKIVVMSLFGVGESFKNNNFLMRWIFNNSAMDQTIADGNAVDGVVKTSGLRFVLVRSCALMGDKVTAVKELGDEGELAGFMPSISAPTVARFLLDAVESSEWDGRTPVISA
ncbi:uncharacterized protein HMPREF1541_08215 [Cyphellophora europaea CBS 101466]|uniref:NAD(P)-binding domain-containing protein n=1 Tax=Cyphellophora europaea (strain CBS 101466) TaxID=1220924 RepID=W2RLM7_CYPE1|nr:uncharacterized protein HMPREF1541_08215 [Cyphellophora europaea CBS 101466]ETN37225.1 hypothetical protein HMPREF1541_08215 [Cyphellophora europaea CBS 101466]